MIALRSGAATDIGRVRRNNQDHYLVDGQLFAVADGMGGAVGGEEASQTAVAALKATFQAHPTADGLADGIRNANRAVWEKSRAQPDLRGMGTTMTAVALVENESEGEVLAIANVGDSRVYLLRDGELEQMTDDHSVPEELRRAGRLTPEEAASHPQRNVLTRALGIEPDVEVDCFPIIPYKGDRLVLASDGLFNEVDHDGIASVARRQRDPEAAAAELVRLAREGGGNDNITVVIVDVVDDDDRAAKASAAVAGDTAAAPTRRPSTHTAAAPAAASAGSPRSMGRSVPPDPEVTPQRRTGIHSAADDQGRRITLRVVLFVLALMMVLGAAVAATGFFARAGYFVGLEGDEVVIFKGRPGGLLWFDPTVADRTGVKASDLLPRHSQDLREGKEEPSLSAARRYVSNLEEEAAPPTTTTTTIPAITAVPPAPGGSTVPPVSAAP